MTFLLSPLFALIFLSFTYTTVESYSYEKQLQTYLDSYPSFLDAHKNYRLSHPIESSLRLSYTVDIVPTIETTTAESTTTDNFVPDADGRIINQYIPTNFTFTFRPQTPETCLPLLSSGTIYGAQYSRPPNNETFAEIIDKLFSKYVNKNLRLAQIGIPWSVLEQTPNQPNYLIITEIIENCFRAGLLPLLTIGAIDTNRVTVPSDLMDPTDYTKLRSDLNWTSTELLTRYAQLVSVIAPIAVYYDAPYFGVGNEVTSNLYMHPETAYAFAGFVYVFRQFIQNLTSTDVKVGVTFITGDLAHMVSDPQPWISNLILVSDINPLTYYPLMENCTVITNFSEINTTIYNALSILPTNDCLVFQELGFPSGYGNSSSTDGSNQQAQADFFTTFLPYLNEVNRTMNPIRAVSIYQFLDMTPQACEGLAPYYVNTTTPPAFLEYLCTLGLVDVLTAEPKLAYQAILDYFSVN